MLSREYRTLLAHLYTEIPIHIFSLLGVTMWETFNGGRSPYPGVDSHTLPTLLQQGHRMEMPSNSACSEHM